MKRRMNKMTEVDCMHRCPRCKKNILVYYPREKLARCPECGITVGGKHVPTKEEREKRIKILEELIALDEND
jgi:ribosomal protein L37AE/L43A